LNDSFDPIRVHIASNGLLKGLLAWITSHKIEIGRIQVTKDTFMTTRWNNWLNIGMGVPTLAYAVWVLASPFMSDLASFLVIAGIGAVY
jgi:hypothetical protein